ncbi:MAG: hypothetical protein Q8P46_09905, partial [Hyphomicrobiales bacterium]|nr:hypothetical protein [Hyphomicrobiales bacterium]
RFIRAGAARRKKTRRGGAKPRQGRKKSYRAGRPARLSVTKLQLRSDNYFKRKGIYRKRVRIMLRIELRGLESGQTLL